MCKCWFVPWMDVELGCWIIIQSYFRYSFSTFNFYSTW